MEADLIEFVAPRVGGVLPWIGIDNWYWVKFHAIHRGGRWQHIEMHSIVKLYLPQANCGVWQTIWELVEFFKKNLIVKKTQASNIVLLFVGLEFWRKNLRAQQRFVETAPGYNIQ